MLPIVGCKSAGNGQSSAKEIIGKDDRVKITDPKLRSRLGLLHVGDHKCNAALIGAGRIMTVEHCLGEKASQFVGFTFTNFEGKSAKVTEILGLDAKKDLAIYDLSRSDFSFFEMSFDAKVTDKIKLAGYDVDSESELESNCTVDQVIPASGVMTYNCDTKPGMSGSAILRGMKIIGLHAAYDKATNQNVGLDFASQLNESADVKTFKGLSYECCHIRNVINVPHIRYDGPTLGSIIADIGHQIAPQVAGQVSAQAESGGWTSANCAAVGAGAILLPAAAYIAPPCAASGFITSGIGVPACVAGVSASAVGLVCIELCQEHHLQDCR